MARAGRLLEQVVALYEGALGPAGVTVKSPDTLIGRSTGTGREIDISLRGRMGSLELLVIIECRDRRGSEDVRWLEQLESKREEVGANKAVAVSSAGFSRPAEMYAAAHGIDLRTVEELDPVADLFRWAAFDSVLVDNRRVEILATSMHVVPEDLPDEEIQNFAAETLVAWSPDALQNGKPALDAQAGVLSLTDESPASITQVWDAFVAAQPAAYADVPVDGTRLRRSVALDVSNLANPLSVRTSGHVVGIERIDLTVDLWIDRTVVPISAVRAYRSADGVLAESVEVKLLVDGAAHVLVVTHAPDIGFGVGLIGPS